MSEVYRKGARFTLIFVSEAYARKLWSNHERKSAQSRAFEERREYILPARFDDTEVPGILPTIGYIDLRVTSPEELADLVLEKLGRPHLATRASTPDTQAVLDLVLRVQSRTVSLAESIAAVLRFAKTAGISELERFCVFELLGYPNESPDEDRSLSLHRAVRFFCSPAQINLTAVGLQGSTVRSAIEQNRELFVERDIVIPESISSIETRLRDRDPRGTWRLKLPVSFFNSDPDDPNMTINCYAEPDAYKNLVEQIRHELTRRLTELLAPGAV
ncbi:MAG: TIR domain-containing protein [Gemmatimonadaceae bacterium]|nr:TIR domain-containing protein [Gemmatimonadaceae bacterium]